MTTETFTPPTSYVIDGIGPYPVGHEYNEGALTCIIYLNGVLTPLTAVDFSASPTASETSGNVYLSEAISTAYDTGDLYIIRKTNVEQGWVGVGGAREASLEKQIDRISRGVQELQNQMTRTFRVPFNLPEIGIFVDDADERSGRVVIFDEDGNPKSGPTGSDIENAQAYATQVATDKLVVAEDRAAVEAAFATTFTDFADMAARLPAGLANGTRVKAGAFLYDVDATSPLVVSSTGLRPVPDASGKYNLLMWGADNLGIADTVPYLEMADAFRKSLPDGSALHLVIPCGLYKMVSGWRVEDFVTNPLRITLDGIINYTPASASATNYIFDFQNYVNEGRVGPTETRPIVWRGGGKVVDTDDRAAVGIRLTDIGQCYFDRPQIECRAGIAVQQRNYSVYCENNTFVNWRFIAAQWFSFKGAAATGGPGGHESMARTRVLNGFGNGQPNTSIMDLRHAIDVDASLYHSNIDFIGGNPGRFIALIKWDPSSAINTSISGLNVESMGSGLDYSGTVSFTASDATVTITNATAVEDGTEDITFSETFDVGRRITLIGAASDGTDWHTRVASVTSSTEVEVRDAPPTSGPGTAVLHGIYLMQVDNQIEQVRTHDNQSMGFTQYNWDGIRTGGQNNRFAYDYLDYPSPPLYLDNWDKLFNASLLGQKVFAKRMVAQEFSLRNTAIYEEQVTLSGTDPVELGVQPWSDNFGLMLIFVIGMNGASGLFICNKRHALDGGASVERLGFRTGTLGQALSMTWTDDYSRPKLSKDLAAGDGLYHCTILSLKQNDQGDWWQ